jgi:glycosyltransferase involved in cell wall biosynthesis
MMYVSGFTFVRSAILYDYPVVESIRSMLPLCDEVVVAVGDSNDGTLELIQSIASDRIKIVQTNWDNTLREGGRVLAQETDKALAATNPAADWCIYLQADEVIHEDDIPTILASLIQHCDQRCVEGLLFDYLHFYGSYKNIGLSRRWYRREIRVIRRGIGIKSWKDAQGFRHSNDHKLSVKRIGAKIFHYGWVKHPSHQQAKQWAFHRLWHSDGELKKKLDTTTDYIYDKSLPCAAFVGTHPHVMHTRVEKSTDWATEYDVNEEKWTIKERISRWIEQRTSWRIGEYQNYKVLK